ncbi:MAG: M28 family peptidase [Sphingomonas sp.]|jgi:Zn-dependent M28 family amino/carboxypeptidase|uniref:M28 family peptidase n=1 Tax=Sphingomonas sp. TaxID=28214 RepID=UPI003568641A
MTRDALSRLIALLAALAVFTSPLLILLWLTAVPGESFHGALPAMTAEQRTLATRLHDHVVAIASEPHNTAHPAALENAARYIERQLAGMGYTVHRQSFEAGGHRVRNIAVTITPAVPTARTLVVGAHYDSAYDAPGANDNGSGVAALLEIARDMHRLDGRATMRLRLVFFVNEEPPWFQTHKMGSYVYATHLARTGERVAGMLALETIGYYSDRPHSQRYPFPLDMMYPDRGNFVAFVGMTGSRGFVRKTSGAFRAVAPFPSVGGSAPGFLQGIDWSDHWSFAQVGVPALMVTDTALFRYRFYHTVNDTPDRVDYDRLARVVSGLDTMIHSWRD